MDMEDIKQVAARKRQAVDIEKLREKIAKERKNVVKLKVAQDTAYWDLKEKLRELESNHEKLQQNMLEVQMQYETVSGQYQDELRNRAETMNKLASNREICSVLEDYCERLRSTLAIVKSDQAALYEAYQKSGEVLKELKAQKQLQLERCQQKIDNLEEKVKLTSEHNNQLIHFFNEEKQRSASELQEERNKFNTVVKKNTELVAANNELGALVDHKRYELEKKEEQVLGLQRDMKQLYQEFNNKATEMQNNMLKLEKDHREATASNESLKQALRNQETFTKTLCEEKIQLLEKFAMIEEDQIKAGLIVKDLETKLKDANRAKELLQADLKSLTEKSSKCEGQLFEKCETVTRLENELMKLSERMASEATEKDQQINNLSDRIAALDIDRQNALTALEKANDEAQALIFKQQEMTEHQIAIQTKILEFEDMMKASKEAATSAELKVKELTVAIEKKEKEIKQISDIRENQEKTIQKLRQEMETKVKELATVIEEKEKDISSKSSTISRLTKEIKHISDAHENQENTIQKLRQEMETKVKELETVIEDKEIEIGCKSSTISQLMKEIKNMSDAHENQEKTIQKLRQEMETKVKELETVIEEKDKDLVSKGSTITHLMNEIKHISDARVHLETTVKNKDMELSKNFAVILELRNEKEHLAATIKNMQNKIDNIQKELTQPVTNPRARFEPEQDDNAVAMLTPSTKRSRLLANVGSELPSRQEDPYDTMIMNFLSDDSMDANRTIDASLVNRRFEAMSRGERLSPVIFRSNKRRVPAAAAAPAAPGPSSQSGPRAKQTATATAEERPTQDQPSATQVKPRKFFKTSRNEKRHTKF